MNINKPVKKTFDPSKIRKIFINHMNSWFSNFVIEELRTEAVSDPKIVKNEFIGTKNNTNMKLPYLFEPTEIKIEYNPHYEQEIFKCDVFIYNIEDADLNEIEYIIKGLKTLKHTSEKTLIIITSIMTWARTQPKYLKEGPQMNEVSEKQAAEENLNEKNQKVATDKTASKGIIVPFEDFDYTLRLPAKRFYQYKMIETIALTASNVNPMIKTYIICPGLTYGCGENIFYDYFKMAWLDEPGKLPVIGDGNNSIPTIHIKDLASIVKRVVERVPDEKYIFAVDRTKNRSLTNLIESISKSVGSGLVENIRDYSMINKIPMYSFLSIDVKCKTSKLFEDKRGDYEDKEDFIAKKFKWHCEFGIPENIDKIRKEFNLFRNLKPVKIFITGPPASGKSTLSQLLSQFYSLPVFNVKDLIERAKFLPEEDSLAHEIRAKIEELKDKMVAEHEEAQKKLKISKKKIEPLDRSNLNPRLPEELIIKIIKRFFNTNTSRNKGYILDGYPKNYSECQGLFFRLDTEGDNLKSSIDFDLAPNNVIRLDMATDEYLKNRIKSNNELAITNPQHYSDEAMIRRFTNFKNFNETAKTQQTLGSFFRENNIEIVTLDCKMDFQSLLKETRKVIEIKGKIKTFKKYEDPRNTQTKLINVEKSLMETSKDILFTKE